MENIRHVLASRPWATNQNIVRNAPFGFLMPGDGHLLYYLAKDAVCGDGAVVDAGSFVGRSAWFLAHGLEDNSRPTTDAMQVHCFDNFLVNGEMTVHAIARHSGNELKVGDRTRFLFDQHMAPIRDRIVVHDGDLLKSDWTPQPVDLLHVDIAKSEELNGQVLKLFFPSLIPGQSLVVHQDYHHLWLPHIHVSMESLSESFEMVEFKVDGAAVFNLTTAIPGEMLERAIRYQFSREEKLDLMDGALARVPRELSYIMRLTRALLIGQLVGLNAAKREFDSIVSEFGADLETDRQWMQNRDALAGWLKAPPEWVERSGE